MRASTLCAVLIATLLCGAAAEAGAGQESGPVRILLDQPPRMVDYQIGRLTADELTRAERKADDVRYRPIYVALLTRAGLTSALRDEALTALVAMDRSTPVRVLLDGLARVAASDRTTGDRLVAMLLAQPRPALQADRVAIVTAIAQDAPAAAVLRGAFGALLLGDDNPDAAFTLARGRATHLVELLHAAAALPSGTIADVVRARLVAPVAAAVNADDGVVKGAALEALARLRADGVTAGVLASQIQSAGDAGVRTAAVRAALAVPASVWPSGQIEPVIRALIAQVTAVPPERRTNADVVDALQLGDRLAAVLPGDTGRTARRDLRALGVQVVPLETVAEDMRFDRWWFVVEAGRSVQIAFTNRDAMPHNVIVGEPGTLAAIGTAAAALPLPSDAAVKPYVPGSADVLASTFLVPEGETVRLNFRAPSVAGEYVFLCSFPGHWARMYGVMLVVPDLDAWEAASRTPPRDPISHQPFPSSQR